MTRKTYLKKIHYLIAFMNSISFTDEKIKDIKYLKVTPPVGMSYKESWNNLVDCLQQNKASYNRFNELVR